jgi:CheY-like chemotaxis protein
VRQGTTKESNCRMLIVGPDSAFRSSLGELVVQADGLVRLHHIESGFVALDVLSKLPEPELPHIVIIPFRLPILTSFDFISAMHSHEQLRSTPILVWWPEMNAQEIDQLYRAGAACVLLGQFDASHIDAVQQFVRKLTGIEAAMTVSPALRAAPSASHRIAQPGDRNVRLGALFVWTGSVSAALWVCGLLQLSSAYKAGDFAPLPVYGSLAWAGFSLMWAPAHERVLARHEVRS